MLKYADSGVPPVERTLVFDWDVSARFDELKLLILGSCGVMKLGSVVKGVVVMVLRSNGTELISGTEIISEGVLIPDTVGKVPTASFCVERIRLVDWGPKIVLLSIAEVTLVENLDGCDDGRLVENSVDLSTL